MASIKISDISFAGADLFQDSESFLHELNEQEVGDISGGGWFVKIAWTALCFGSC